MLHTIIDINEVFNTEYSKNMPDMECKRVDNCIVYGVKCKEGFQVQQIFSTDPSDYLSYDVGSIIK